MSSNPTKTSQNSHIVEIALRLDFVKLPTRLSFEQTTSLDTKFKMLGNG